jgi:glycosyltransferase involved in cell wall biosynthesis
MNRFPLMRPTTSNAHGDGSGSGEPVIAYVGALAAEKGVDTAIDAMRFIRGGQLLIAGDGPRRADLLSLAQAVAPDRIRFLGPVDHIREIYAAADVVVLPSRGGDSMPAVLIEAALSGVPCVATPVQGIPEIVQAGVTGELVAPDNPAALAEGIRSAHARRIRYAVAAREHCVANFEIGVVATAWEAVINRVVA